MDDSQSIYLIARITATGPDLPSILSLLEGQVLPFLKGAKDPENVKRTFVEHTRLGTATVAVRTECAEDQKL